MHKKEEQSKMRRGAFKEMTETGKDILMQERGGTYSPTVNTWQWQEKFL